MPQKTAMTRTEMEAILDELQPGDKFRFVFADLPVDSYRIQMFLVLCTEMMGGTPTLNVREADVLTLCVIHDSKDWAGFRDYEATVLEGFDPEDFAYRTLRHGLLESITKL